ncbi:hypothetical protein A2673_04105 [Candidatus Kaiserbacteria bacterium RIFCSPHIGHO2_01_FULL_50_13]|uniref:Protein NO VEIN C-terminal domain-containing protein n=1 Tax=Candidatus Kaiserbacteria bacterium RIFCSPLOWO2_01_FULL_50_24 TaxID=1798507 RepID=A0A1F6EP16_9BACT|nr:MAG: hypothetical protein A2673_04105 [Candidatus Kaiserbacteria bacterium RIFCSPHIGHO2_01_FULL_50_13]OGG75082.1 MAG: hypothetical protein A3A34_01850 [Candidatus Kaiserbacteria bacterium RIFCSPLOWO2_01_FULL_50_24]OGG82123.1 MAG: hypothetical protein A3H74_00275 [Candidatus Kaiserbacteria bacterium RIFCSPLOWO2_02_FULL_51_13]
MKRGTKIIRKSYPARRRQRELRIEKGREGKRRGKENEQRLIDAYEAARHAKQLPTWLTVVRPATKTEDYHQKTDAVAITDVGPIHIQIKSSERACAAFMETGYGRYILCVVVHDNESPEDLVNRTLPKIAARRHARIQKRKPR